jgi:hypothetical protein
MTIAWYNPANEKKCCVCGLSKLHSEFYKLDAKCKPCRRELINTYSRTRKKEDPKYAEAKKAYWKEYNTKHKERKEAYRLIRFTLPGIQEKRKAYSADYRLKNQKEINAAQRRYAKQPEIMEKDKMLRRKYETELTDSIVKRRLTKGTLLTAKDIPQSLVEVKRLQLLINRSLQNEKC